MSESAGAGEALAKGALLEICRRIEAPLPADVETQRELSAHRRRLLDTVYAIAENAMTEQSRQQAALQALVEQWRELQFSPGNGDYYLGRDAAFAACADELAALLSQSQP
jgi:hypothetical protein